MSYPPCPARGFALISVLALVTLAALMTTAFLASGRLERMSSRSVGDQARLNIALDMGCDLAQNMLVERSTLWHTWINFLYQADSNGVGYPIQGSFLANPNPASRGWQYGYLFSPTGVAFRNHVRWYATNSQFGFQVANGGAQSAFPEAAGSKLTPMITWLAANSSAATRIPLLGGRTSPPVAWITNFTTVLTTNTNLWLPTHRVAYYVEDLSGFFDAERMGGVSSRSTGTNPQEIQLAALGVTNTSGFTNSRRAFLTWGLLDAFLRSNANTNAAFFATGLRSLNGNLSVAGQPKTNRGYDRIPPGLGYAMAESNRNSQYPKWNLNGTFTNLAGPYGNANATNVDQIAGVLLTNVPGFTNRAGGFPPGAYLLALASSIKDYVDSDSSPSYTNVANTDIRGLEALPFVNERVTLFNMIQTNAANIGGVSGLMLTIMTQDFYEFWNPHSKATPAVSLSVVASNSLGFTLGIPTFNFNNPTAATNSAGQQVLNGQTTNTFNLSSIQPNGFLVRSSLAVTNFFFYPNTNPPIFPGIYQGNTNFFRYQVYLGGVSPTNMYDRSRLGCFFAQNANLSQNINNSSPANRRFFGSYSAFAAQTPLFTFRTTMGDPRMAFYLNDNQDQVTYATGSSFGGRNLRSGTPVTSNYHQVMISLWPDGGHNSPQGNAAGSALPDAVPIATYSNLPPGRISDSGSFSNIVELGNIYDPIQWRDRSFLRSSGFGSEPNGGQWSVLSANTDTNIVAPDNRFGGGNSLRIGRAEHPRFAWTNPVGGTNPAQPNMQQSAAALLDLFTVAQDSRTDEGGKININTAPPAVLRALAAGVVLTNDPNQVPASFSVPAQAVDAFVTGVTNFRAKYPFYSPSQLAFIGTDPAWPNTNSWPAGAVFGTTNFGTGSTLVTAWNDAAAEEWFSRIYGLSKTFGRHFRIYVVAQMLSTNTNSTGDYLPRGTPARKYYQVYLRPNDNPAPDVGPLITVRAAY